MSIKFKDMNMKNSLYYFFHDIDIKSFDPNINKKDEKSNKNNLIYYIGYVTMKDSKLK